MSALIIAGILIGNALPPSGLSIALICTILGIFVAWASVSLMRAKVPSPLLSIVAAVALVLAGVLRISVDRDRTVHPPARFLRHEVVVVGRVADPPVEVGSQTRFQLEARFVRDSAQADALPANILVTLKRTRSDAPGVPVRYGMNVALAGMLTPLSDERNPGEFSQKQYLEANGISMSLFVRSHLRLMVLDSVGGAWPVRQIVLPARQYILSSIDRDVGGEEGEFLKGLLIGVRTGMGPAVRQAFMNAGVTHVLAVSGSNVAVVVAFLFFLFEFLRLPKSLRLLATSIAVLFYMVLTGSQPPVVRATVMALVFMLGGIVQRKSNAFNALGLSALIILCIDSRQLFDVGFQLSFGAVLSIVYLYPIANRWISVIPGTTLVHRLAVWLLRVCALSLVATLGTLPLTAIYFGRVSLVGVAANLFVIPAVSVSVILGSVSAVVGVISHWAASAYQAVNWLVLRVTLAVISMCGNASFAYADTSRFRLLDALPFYAALALIFHFPSRVLMKRLVIIFLLACNIAVYYPESAAYAQVTGKLRLSFIDVGEGDAILAEFPGGATMLVDAGPRTFGLDAGERVVAPFLKRRGVSTIDLFVASHPHSDHVGGLSYILNHFPVRRIIDVGAQFRSVLQEQCGEAAAGRPVEFDSVCAGQQLPGLSGVRVYVLSPFPQNTNDHHRAGSPSTANTSLVLKLQYGNVSILLTGDAERKEEREMLDAYGGFLKSSVLKVGHNGSSTSSTEDFLAAVQPSAAVISVGRNNKFRHPSADVVRRLEALGVALSRTDEDGAVIFESDGRALSRVDWR